MSHGMYYHLTEVCDSYRSLQIWLKREPVGWTIAFFLERVTACGDGGLDYTPGIPNREDLVCKSSRAMMMMMVVKKKGSRPSCVGRSN